MIYQLIDDDRSAKTILRLSNIKILSMLSCELQRNSNNRYSFEIECWKIVLGYSSCCLGGNEAIKWIL